MRSFNWGKYPAQHTDFSSRYIQGSSIILDGATSNGDNSGLLNDPTVRLDNAGTNGSDTRTLLKVALAKVRVSLGHTPVIVRASLVLFLESQNPGYSVAQAFYRMVTIPDMTDASRRYADVSASIAWGGDPNIYGPVPGVDYLAAPFASITVPAGQKHWGDSVSVDLTSELGYCLQANKDIVAVMMYTPFGLPGNGQQMIVVWYDATYANYYPFITVQYMNPVEFFACKPTGAIDLMKLLDNSTGLDLNSLYLGAVEVSQTSTPVSCRVKNIGSRALPHLEIWDDRPEWSTPAANTGNAGTAALEYPTLADASLSQKYTIKFTSPTAYQVIGQAYKDNSADLNPTYGTTGWTGAVGADFIAPSGGLTIPTAAWSGTAVANDTIVVYVTGNSTDITWAADSNDQVQIAKDNGSNAPDANTWRPVCGQRTILTGTVTIDATSKTLTVRHIVVADWPNGTKVFVANAATIDEGTVTGQTATSLTVTFPSATSHAYAVGDKVGSTLPVRGLGTSLWAKTTGAAGASQSNPAWIPLTGALALGFTAGMVCSIQSVADTTLQEEFTIAAAGVDSTHILALSLLANDYTTGAMIIAAGTGEAQFWLKIQATATTLEERKQLRLAVRT